jgi:hypothetical protein
MPQRYRIDYHLNYHIYIAAEDEEEAKKKLLRLHDKIEICSIQLEKAKLSEPEESET